MAYKLENIIFLYEHRTEAQGEQPRVHVVVYKDGRVKWRSEETIYGDEDDVDRRLRLSGRGMERLMAVIADNARLAAFEKAEQPEEDWGEESRYKFYFDNGECKILIRGIDFQYCTGGQKRREKYPLTNDLFSMLKQIGKVLSREGVGKECFKIPRKIWDSPFEPDPNPIVKRFVVYDFRKEENIRSNERYRLEHYFFYRYKDGSYMFEYQEGWDAGSHYDGGTAHNDLPKKWFKLSWEKFLDKFIAEYPPSSYFITRDELANNGKLKKFLGF